MSAVEKTVLPTLTCREWQEFRVEPGGLKEAQVDRLHGLAIEAAKRLRLPETAVLTRTHQGLRAQQVVGVLTMPGLTLEILPKIEGDEKGVRNALIQMLAIAYDLRVSEGELTALDTQRSDLLELLIRLFCERLLAAAKHGLSRHYVAREDDLPVLRGGLMVKRQFTINVVRPDRLACRFDELSEDTPINRVLRTAVLRLSRIARTAENMRRLDELESRLRAASVSIKPLSEPVRLDRTNQSFHLVYRLARLFLAGDWQSTVGGGAPGFALLFPMNDLFEAFVGRMMRRAMTPTPVRLQDRKYFALRHVVGGAGAFALEPDIVLETRDGPIIVDTKWKPLDPAKGANHGVLGTDVYQMLAYAHAYQAKRLILLYPWDSHLGAPGIIQRWMISGTSHSVEAATVSLGKTETVLDQLSAIMGSF